MPIRFRCAYCNQLMAISRRKMGGVVRCPKCAGEIIVPSPEGTQAAEDDLDQPARVDDPDPGLSQHPTVKAPAENGTPARDDTPFSTSGLKRRGLFIPLGALFLLIGVALLVLILTFVIGLLVGKSM